MAPPINNLRLLDFSGFQFAPILDPGVASDKETIIAQAPSLPLVDADKHWIEAKTTVTAIVI